jgi:hypothetical protein
MCSHLRRGVEFDGVPLSVSKAEPMEVEPPACRDGRNRGRVEPTGQEYDGWLRHDGPSVESSGHLEDRHGSKGVDSGHGETMKKSLAVLAITIAGLFSGGAALALTGGSAMHDQGPATTDSSATNSSTASSETSESSRPESESTSTESDTESSDTDHSSESDSQSSDTGQSTESESSEPPESSDSESEGSDSESSEATDEPDSGKPAKHEHPHNHGADVSKAAHECPKGPGHGQCVGAVAHEHG